MTAAIVCARCGGKTAYIGISGAAPLVCVRDCAGRCPACLSSEIEPFSRWSLIPIPGNEKRCVPCGKVWTET